MTRLKVLALLIVFVLTGSIFSIQTNAKSSKVKDLPVQDLFTGFEGTTVIKNLKTDTVYIYNQNRSKERFTPESTFKVPNALIGLETKAVNDEYEVKRWDGIAREFDGWNTDHSLASAMRQSAIWFYQDMARDIGINQMQLNLNKINYGNNNISGGIDTFWLNSSLKISAQEQTGFIEKLVKENLSFKQQNMKTVKRIMINEEYNDYTVHGKTGTRLSDLGLGWYVGYVETNKDTWVFATNINSSGSKAKEITLKCLMRLNIIKNYES
ncbi:class D beta-lactamase [Lederbergia citrea]|uniref:class D beta-lactamase n=1 Tax=Lederbergia citrea TaxID=2833581 RepID=UPI001BC967B3|nr:class D beta-lactamase [Lederbergia citrea]MBS4177024.1 class D beta-lactamase [Lederbergia citrea]